MARSTINVGGVERGNQHDYNSRHGTSPSIVLFKGRPCGIIVAVVLAKAVLGVGRGAGPRKRWSGRSGGGREEGVDEVDAVAETMAETVAETPFAMYYLFNEQFTRCIGGGSWMVTWRRWTNVY
jgi:hypothetical protein